MHEQTEKLIETAIRDAKRELSENSKMPVTWYMVKDEMAHMMSLNVGNDVEKDTDFCEETAKLAAEWIEPDYAIQVMNAEMTDPQQNPIEVLGIILHTPDERPLTWLFKVNRLNNGQVLFITEWLVRKYVSFGGVLFSPYEKLQTTPSQEAIATVRKLLGHSNRPMFRVVGG